MPSWCNLLQRCSHLHAYDVTCNAAWRLHAAHAVTVPPKQPLPGCAAFLLWKGQRNLPIVCCPALYTTDYCALLM